jgi:selenide,water dikinase
MKDLEKRKRVMDRSIRLGHCICDPKKPCPCDLLRTKDVCLCAGEQMDEPAGPIRLTRLVENAGCASKIDKATLKRVLGNLPSLDDPRVLIGMAAGDDAGVFRLDSGPALVQTVDVFSPSVDDPYLFGQISAANSVSDIYAMGAKPITALSILGFPVRKVPDRVMEQILRGGIDKMTEAGVPVIGGHSIKDDEIKAGFAVTGLVDPDHIMTNAAALPGDVMVLTKPLGTGIISFAAQIDRAPAGSVEAAGESMAALNKTASELMLEADAHACTDITGFGLIGHLGEVAAQSSVDVEIVWDDLPLLPGVLECLEQGIIPGGVERNRESSAFCVRAGAGVTPTMLDVCFDPQTSGGLLIILPEAKAAGLVKRLHDAGIPVAAVVGKATGKGSGIVRVVTTGRRKLPAPSEACCVEPAKEKSMAEEKNDPGCCPEDHGSAAPAAGATAAAGVSGVSAVQQKFAEFMKAASAPGALDAATKQAIAIALSVLAKCEPCTKNHIRKARAMGFTSQEIDEAVWMAIAFGGSPVMMFYNSVKGD